MPVKVGTIHYGARVQVIDEQAMRYVTVATCEYTPKAIQAALLALGLQSAWVRWGYGRELWQVGAQLAQEV